MSTSSVGQLHWSKFSNPGFFYLLMGLTSRAQKMSVSRTEKFLPSGRRDGGRGGVVRSKGACQGRRLNNSLRKLDCRRLLRPRDVLISKG